MALLFKLGGFKGINLAWGLDTDGTSGFPDSTVSRLGWLENTIYDANTMDIFLDLVATGSIKTLGCWLFLDGQFMDKTGGPPAWGATGWVPAWKATTITNWESFLSKCQSREIKVIPTLMIGAPSAGPTYEFEQNCLLPTIDGADVIGYTGPTAKGDIPEAAQATGAANWRYTGTAGNFTYTASPGAGPMPSGVTSSIDITATAAATVRSPIVAFPTQNLLRCEMDLKGDPSAIYLGYYNNSNVQVGNSLTAYTVQTYTASTISFDSTTKEIRDSADGFAPIVKYFSNGVPSVRVTGGVNAGTYTIVSANKSVIVVSEALTTAAAGTSITLTTTFGAWATYSFPTSNYNLPSGATKLAVQVAVSSGSSANIGGTRVAYASQSAKYQNYIDAINDFCVTLYGNSTTYGPVIAGYLLINEVFANLPYWQIYSFLKDIYDTISGATATAVIQDSVPATDTVKATVAVDQQWFGACDVVFIHSYDDEGDFPDMSACTKPWGVGETAATGNPPVAATNAVALQAAYDAVYARGALCCLGWQLITSLADETLDGGVIVSMAWTVPGQVVADWTAAGRSRNARPLRGLKNEVP